jgi:hypothetical protein
MLILQPCMDEVPKMNVSPSPFSDFYAAHASIHVGRKHSWQAGVSRQGAAAEGAGVGRGATKLTLSTTGSERV